ncbi:unnamed protein product, partial [Symbiodinium sp. CCMP2456]
MKLGSSRAFGSFRALTVLAWVLCWATSRSFKLSGSPIPVTDSENATVQEIVEEVVADDLKQDMDEINNMSNPMTENASDPSEGFGALAKNLEFLLVKVAQLEAVAEMQQAELISYRKKFDSQQKEIDSLKAQIGNHEPQDGGALLEMEQKDAQTRLQEAQDVVKRVFRKHHRQRETGILRHEEEIAGESQESSSDRESGFWKHRRRRFPNVIVDSGRDAGNAAVNVVTNPIDTLKDGYNAAKDKAEWLKNNAISTVEQAVAILSQGFSDFGASCPNSAAPSIRTFNAHELKIYFGDLRCKLSLMGQSTPLFGLNFGEHRIALPSQLTILFHLGWELVHSCTGTHNHIEVTKCLARSLAKFSPPVDFLPDQLKKVANGQVLDLLPGPVQLVAGSAYEAVRTVFSVGFELMHCPHRGHHHQLIACLGRWIQHFAPPMNWMPHPVHALANGQIIGNIMGLMPGPMQLLGGGQTNSIQNMLALGDALMKCSDSQQQDLVQCLGFQIVGSVPPLNFLNRLGDIFGEFIAAFAKVASTVAAQAMKGGESLLQTAATTEFPSAGAQAMVHHR